MFSSSSIGASAFLHIKGNTNPSLLYRDSQTRVRGPPLCSCNRSSCLIQMLLYHGGMLRENHLFSIKGAALALSSQALIDASSSLKGSTKQGTGDECDSSIQIISNHPEFVFMFRILTVPEGGGWAGDPWEKLGQRSFYPRLNFLCGTNDTGE
jgi:hypothetical protein